MGKFIITYDENNKKEKQDIEDFFFIKYYIKSLLFDFKNFIDEMKTECVYKPFWCCDCECYIINKNINIIKQHLNKFEYSRLLNICKSKIKITPYYSNYEKTLSYLYIHYYFNNEIFDEEQFFYIFFSLVIV